MLLRFNEFLLENNINEGSIPIYRGKSFNPIDSIKTSQIISRIQSFLDEVAAGNISEVTIVAEIPSQGKNAPDYLKDIYKETETEIDDYDSENDTYSGRKDYDETVFVDSEFVVTDVDVENGVVIAEPHSLKGKDIVVEIPPSKIEEIFVN